MKIEIERNISQFTVDDIIYNYIIKSYNHLISGVT